MFLLLNRMSVDSKVNAIIKHNFPKHINIFIQYTQKINAGELMPNQLESVI